MSEPIWLAIARHDIGTAETPGKATTPKIRQWLIDLGAWWQDDETPWCGVAVAAWMSKAGCEVPKHYYRAKAWADWGMRLSEPAIGSVVVYERTGGGHVGLAVGWDQNGRILTLGGNQGNRVSIVPFDRTRAIAYRWPSEYAASWPEPLPLAQHAGPSSSNEA